MNRKRVQELRNVIAGIPDNQIDLNDFYTMRGGGKPCGTVACMLGWAWIYPPFIEQGIPRGWTPTARFFNVPVETFSVPFHRERGTAKKIALRRLDKLLA